MENSLKECPFCGSNDLEERLNERSSTEGGDPPEITCCNCGSVACKTMWNTRHSPWISIYEKLPEKIEGLPYLEVLVFIESCPCEARIATFEYNDYLDEWKWFDQNQKYKHPLICSDEVTHWMPIKPPKEPK